MKYLCLFLSLLPTFLYSQGFGEYVSKNAVEVHSLINLNNEVYDLIMDYQLIMIGEMHGTQEPAKLVSGIAKVVVENEGQVSVGLEIPQNEVAKFVQSPTDSVLRITEFFSKENIDGRNGESWFDLIIYCNTNPNINLFFYDNFKEYHMVNRDSAMYLTIVQQVKKYPSSKVITLSGNIHNWLIPYKESLTMGYYCVNDTVNFSRAKVCSINHIYSEGTMLNNTGNGIELSDIDFSESIYSESVDFNNYLLFYESSKPYQYSGVLYTRKVNHSKKLRKQVNDKYI
ncbi:MAG: hypothetical protein OCD76_07710 [Reichenbachiella sp.]